MVEDRINALIDQMDLDEKLAMVSGKDCMDTRENSRLGIPALKMADGPHGVRWDMATSFPTGISMGAAWNPELIEEFGVALANETRAKGRNVILGPCVNIHRTPLGGRNFESFTEDPHLAARIAVAYVKGVQSQKVGTSTKHLACNNQEWERITISSEVDRRTLHEIYLPAFKAAVQEADTWTVMGAYNKLNGTYCCENDDLLLRILKEDWGFEGLVVSDWGATHSTAEAANGGLDLEMPGPGDFFNTLLKKAVEDGQVSEDVINDKVRRVLRVMLKMGLFDNGQPHKGELNSERHRKIALAMAQESIVLLKNDDHALPLKQEGLKRVAVVGPNANVARLGGGGSSTITPFYAVTPLDGIIGKLGEGVDVGFVVGCTMPGDLPSIETQFLRPPKGREEEHGLLAEYFDNAELAGEPAEVRVERQINFDWGGGTPVQGFKPKNFSARWSGRLVPAESGRYEVGAIATDTIHVYLDGERVINYEPVHGAEFRIVSMDLEAGKSYDLRVEYFATKGWPVAKLGWIKAHHIEEAAAVARDADVAIVVAGLSPTFEGEGVDRTGLGLPGEQDALIEAVCEANENTIVVLVSGTPVLMDRWLDKVKAVVEAWYPGQEGGKAIADVLFGDVNPCGKLPTTFPKRIEDSAPFENYPGADDKVCYEEGIFVGYRHFDHADIDPLFPFGHGLSYTSFEYSDLAVSQGDGEGRWTVSLNVRNSGERAGKEVVQLYISDVEAKLERPPKELKGFRKVALEPGEQKQMTFEVRSEDLAYYDPSAGGWVAEPGDFDILVGSSSRDIRLQSRVTL